MTQKSKRLPRDEFQSRTYRTSRAAYFLVKAKANDGKGVRVGIVVGKNVHKTAVRRNFWKRQARASLGSVVRGDRDILVIIRPNVNDLTRKQFREALAKSIRELE